jgi:pimeloyl-ACP methyl ester carboxylesterase
MADESGRIVDVLGAQIYVEQRGTGRDIVLVHAGVADSSMWDSQIDAFSKHARVTRYDLRGFGRSTLPPMPYAHHDDLAAVVDHLRIDHAIVIGASFGGTVATAFALTTPDKVDALILVNSRVGSESVSPDLRAAWDRVEAAEEAGDIDLAVEIESQMWVDGPFRTPAEVDPIVRERVRAMNSALFARASEQEAAEERKLDPSPTGRIGEIRVPTLAIVGDLDFPDIMTSADTLVTAIPGAKKATIPGAAHLPSMEKPDEFNRIVGEFIRQSL